MDAFRPRIAPITVDKPLSKRTLVSEIAKIYDVLGWCSPVTIKIKILLQRLWEFGVDWDEVVPTKIYEEWEKWRIELPILRDILIPRCYTPKSETPLSVQLHGFCDASESAYAAVVYLRSELEQGQIHLALVAAKTKVAPIKRQTIPQLELCGAQILARLLHHCANMLEVSRDQVFAWTDSTIVLSWLHGNPRRLKTFVGNRVAEALELFPPNNWNHVRGAENPADCASRGMYANELKKHDLWWQGPQWLQEPQSSWPTKPEVISIPVPAEERGGESELSSVTVEKPAWLSDVSSFNRLKRVTAWILRFIHNSRTKEDKRTTSLNSDELQPQNVFGFATVRMNLFRQSSMILRRENRLASLLGTTRLFTNRAFSE